MEFFIIHLHIVEIIYYTSYAFEKPTRANSITFDTLMKELATLGSWAVVKMLNVNLKGIFQLGQTIDDLSKNANTDHEAHNI